MRASYDAKPYRRMQMETYGGICHPSPSDLTERRPRDARRRPGDHRVARHGDQRGGRGRRDRTPTRTTRWAACSTTSCCTRASSARRPSRSSTRSSESADVVFGCAGGGSNLGGLRFPFLGRNLREGTTTRVVACEPAACPSLTQGEYRYDFGDVAGLTPLLKMHTLGKDFVPPPIHAGGLRYHGMAPMVSHAVELGLHRRDRRRPGRPRSPPGIEFARAEGIIPAPESTHAVAGAIAHARARRPRRRPSSSACPATASWTCPRTTTTSERRRRPAPREGRGPRRAVSGC